MNQTDNSTPDRVANAAGAEPHGRPPVQSATAAMQDDVQDLGAAASGSFLDVDIETAQQRVRDAQTALIAIGYALVDDRHHEPAQGIDGVWGPITRDTVLQFQGDYGLEETSRLDRDTYEELMRTYEQALSMQSHGIIEEDFEPTHSEDPLAEQAVLAEGDDLTLLDSAALADELPEEMLDEDEAHQAQSADAAAQSGDDTGLQEARFPHTLD